MSYGKNHQQLFINLASVSRADGILLPALRQYLNRKLKKPLVINSQMNPAGIASFFISMLAGAIVLTWLYNSTRGSLWIVALFHAMIELMFISKNITVQMSTYLGVTIMIGAVIIILLKVQFCPKWICQGFL